jgi:hypothetical protein
MDTDRLHQFAQAAHDFGLVLAAMRAELDEEAAARPHSTWPDSPARAPLFSLHNSLTFIGADAQRARLAASRLT